MKRLMVIFFLMTDLVFSEKEAEFKLLLEGSQMVLLLDYDHRTNQRSAKSLDIISSQKGLTDEVKKNTLIKFSRNFMRSDLLKPSLHRRQIVFFSSAGDKVSLQSFWIRAGKIGKSDFTLKELRILAGTMTMADQD
jgi:hypothetical protein